MSLNEMQACLTRLYVDDSFRKLFFLDPGAIGEYLLSEAESSAIRGVDRASLEYFAQSLVAKRRGRIERSYPVLWALDPGQLERFYRRYYHLYPLRPNQSVAEDVVAFGQFAEESLMDADPLPAYAATVAKYERLYYTVRFAPPRSRSLESEAAAPHRIPNDDATPWVRDGIETAEFDYDVAGVEDYLYRTGTAPNAAEVAQPIVLAFRPSTPTSAAKMLRVNAATWLLLSLCDGRSVGAMVAAAEEKLGAASLRAQIVTMLDQMLALEVITLSPGLARQPQAAARMRAGVESEGMYTAGPARLPGRRS
jgi:hypothetical protein